MANNIAYIQSFTNVLDRAYKKAAVSTCLNSPRHMMRAEAHAKKISVSKIEVTGIDDGDLRDQDLLGVVARAHHAAAGVDYFTAFATPFQTSLLQCSTVG